MKFKHKIERVLAPAKKIFLSNYQINFDGKGVVGFVDIGSVGGLPSPWAENADKIRILLNFEPNADEELGMNFITSNCALWKERAILPFHIYEGYRGAGSSLFDQNFDFVDRNWEMLSSLGSSILAKSWHKRSALVRTIKVQCRPLDEVISDLGGDYCFDFVKCDAQGAEYEILLGAEKLLSGSCIGLHLELFKIPLYQGIKLAPQVIQLAEKYGFRIEHIFPPHGTFLSQNDYLFLKPSGDKHKLQIIRKVYGLLKD